ncbi:MAG TPA: IPT/TIG domain-containing protein [Fimbriimonadaceae bacterium]|nr:IPT/TIG domain-containing protein [Fimbriimonadaceae bacterium]
MASRKKLQISEVTPTAAIPGGEFTIRGTGLPGGETPQAKFGGVFAPVVIGSESLMIVKVPEGASRGDLTLGASDDVAWTCDIGIQIATELHPVANPVIDVFGNIYTTMSGSAGQKTPVSVYKIESNLRPRALVTDIMNATGLALDTSGLLYVSSRHDGIIYQIAPSGNATTYVEGMGVATGIVFDREDNMYVGDRSGTIFKVSKDRQIYVFATIERSISAYHLALGPDGYLYVTGPTTSSFDVVHRVSPDGQVEIFYRGLGRPQGMAFDVDGNLYVAASLAGRRGVVRITPARDASLFLSGPSIVGLCFMAPKSMLLATANSIFRVDVGVQGRPLP